MRVFILTADQKGLASVVEDSTTTEEFVAQEMMKPNLLVWMPKLGQLVRIKGYGSTHGAVGRPQNVVPQPVVPGR